MYGALLIVVSPVALVNLLAAVACMLVIHLVPLVLIAGWLYPSPGLFTEFFIQPVLLGQPAYCVLVPNCLLIHSLPLSL